MSAKGHKRTFLDSLDQLVGALLEVKRNVESKRLGRLEINDGPFLKKRRYVRLTKLEASC